MLTWLTSWTSSGFIALESDAIAIVNYCSIIFSSIRNRHRLDMKILERIIDIKKPNVWQLISLLFSVSVASSPIWLSYLPSDIMPNFIKKFTAIEIGGTVLFLAALLALHQWILRGIVKFGYPHKFKRLRLELSFDRGGTNRVLRTMNVQRNSPGSSFSRFILVPEASQLEGQGILKQLGHVTSLRSKQRYDRNLPVAARVSELRKVTLEIPVPDHLRNFELSENALLQGDFSQSREFYFVEINFPYKNIEIVVKFTGYSVSRCFYVLQSGGKRSKEFDLPIHYLDDKCTCMISKCWRNPPLGSEIWIWWEWDIQPPASSIHA